MNYNRDTVSGDQLRGMASSTTTRINYKVEILHFRSHRAV